ncbi:MAG TPA: HAD family phosphatase [Anaerolineae bacterium]|nr:HAD family phosphatase [Anaerolineae bacterium]
MSEKKNIRAVYWDMGGVIVRTHNWSGRARWEEQIGLQPHELERIVFSGEMGKQATLGQATSDDVWTWVLNHLGLSENDRHSLERDFFQGDKVDEKLVAFIRSLRPKYRTGMISNAWSELRPWLKELRIADAFDHIVISSEVGLAKPDPRIFQLALDDLGISPQEAVFIDDFEVNIEAAGEIGMHAILFRNTEQTIAELRSILSLNS